MGVPDPRPLEQQTPQVCSVCESTVYTRLVQYRGHGGSGTVWTLEVRCDVCDAVWEARVLMRQYVLDREVHWTRRGPEAGPSAAADPGRVSASWEISVSLRGQGCLTWPFGGEGLPAVRGSDTHYRSGDEIRAGDVVRSAAWTGRVVFVLGSGSFAPGYTPTDWAYLGHGFMIEYDQAGLVFTGEADEDLVLVARAEAGGA